MLQCATVTDVTFRIHFLHSFYTSKHTPYRNEAAGPVVTEADPEPVPVNNDGASQETHSSFSSLWPFGPSSFHPTYQYQETVDEPAAYDPNQIGYSEWYYDH